MEALIHYRERQLNAQVEEEHDLDVKLEPFVGLLGVVGTTTLELRHTAALSEAVVDLSNFVEHCPVNHLLQLDFHLFSELLVVLVDLVAHLLAVFDEFVRVGLILAILHYLLGSRHDSSHKCQSVCR